jgi:acylphosphatase
MEICRAEIVVNGLVQGVGFRYFVLRKAEKFGLKGYTKNLYSGEVFTEVEGPRYLIGELFSEIKIGPGYSNVKNASIRWSEAKNEFTRFEIRH